MSNLFSSKQGQGLVEFVIILAIIIVIVLIVLPGALDVLRLSADKISTAQGATDNSAVLSFLQSLGGK